MSQKDVYTFTFNLFLMCIDSLGHPIYIYIYMVERRNKQRIVRYEPADI